MLVTLVVLGVVLDFTGAIDWQRILRLAQVYAHYWWVPIILIGLQVILFTFALPGSAVVWVAAPLYPPLAATLILTTGGTLGALSAYWLARHESLQWRKRMEDSRFYQILEQRSDFLSLCALRLIPGFLHSIINYGSGILRLPMMRFLSASIVGLAIKFFLYSNAIHGAVTATELSELVRLKTLGPLAILALVTGLAALLRKRWLHKGKQ